MTTYFHGGPAGVQRGAFLLPPTITKRKHCSLYGAAGIHRTDRVYITTDRTAALLFAASWPKGVVYECEPIGDVEPDPDCSVPGLSYQCEKARVRRVIKLSCADIDTARSALIG